MTPEETKTLFALMDEFVSTSVHWAVVPPDNLPVASEAWRKAYDAAVAVAKEVGYTSDNSNIVILHRGRTWMIVDDGTWLTEPAVFNTALAGIAGAQIGKEKDV